MHSGFSKNSILVLFKYGNDVEYTKKQISELGIGDNVIWIPKMSRKEIFFILDFIDMGFVDFSGIFWGNTGWELLAKGIPFFHYYNISEADFLKEYNIPMPEFMNTNSPDFICEELINYIMNPEEYINRGNRLKKWFENYGGVGLAQEWKILINNIYKEKMSDGITIEMGNGSQRH